MPVMQILNSAIAVGLFFCVLNSASAQKISDTVNTDRIVFTKTEEEAYYPGGNVAWSEYLRKALNRFNPASNGAPLGKYQVIARFIVSKDGSLSDVVAETKFGYGMEEKVIDCITNSGKWSPAIQNKRPVNAYRRQPVTFMVESDELKIFTETPFTLYANQSNLIRVFTKNVKPENIDINVTGAKVTSNNYDGTFTIFVTRPGRVTIEVVNTKKNDKLIGTASIEAVEKK